MLSVGQKYPVIGTVINYAHCGHFLLFGSISDLLGWDDFRREFGNEG